MNYMNYPNGKIAGHWTAEVGDTFYVGMGQLNTPGEYIVYIIENDNLDREIRYTLNQTEYKALMKEIREKCDEEPED
jgi:hypothetical protein